MRTVIKYGSMTLDDEEGMMMRVAFIGCGNLTSALIHGLVREKYPMEEVILYDHHPEKALGLAASSGATVADSMAAICNCAELIILAVKPQHIQGVIDEIRSITLEHQVIVSPAAGLPMSLIQEWLGRRVKLIRVMPNLASAVNLGLTAACLSPLVNADNLALFESLFHKFGEILYIDEHQFDRFTAIAGSSPAIVYALIHALEQSGKNLELGPELTRKIAVRTVMGAAALVNEMNLTPHELMQQTASKGGTTEVGIDYLHTHHFESIVEAAVEAMTDRSSELSQKFTSK